MNRNEVLDYMTQQSQNTFLGDYARLAYHRVGDLIVEDRSLKSPERAEDRELFLDYTAGLDVERGDWYLRLVGDPFDTDAYGLDHSTLGVYAPASSTTEGASA